MSQPGTKRFEARELRAAMSHFCSGVVVVTGVHEGHPVGLTAQSFVSLSLDPPLVAFCPARSSRSWPKLRDTGHYCINILGADQRATCEMFARSGGDKFSALEWRPGQTGAPVIENVLGIIECRLDAEHAAGDHTIAVGHVLHLEIFDARRGPLLFFRGGYGDFRSLEGS
jgi:flavin reductase (DIM6/NTAB) family NADH-FMN oxidoreductase RutF